MSKPLVNRLYWERPLYETVRLIGYGGIDFTDFWDRAKQLKIEVDGKPVPFIGDARPSYTNHEVLMAVYDVTRMDKRSQDPACYELNAEARKAATQLLGIDPEHKLADFWKYGPVDVMGDEAALKWQEKYRQEQADKAEEAAQEQPKKRARKGKSR